MGDAMNFGIIPAIDPQKMYYPQRGKGGAASFFREYGCIAVPDDVVNEWISETERIPTYAGGLKYPSTGIDHYGVTLVGPERVGEWLAVIRHHGPAQAPLIALLQRAENEKRYVVCFGI